MSVDLKHLSKIIALCRKTGVVSLEIDNLKLALSANPPSQKRKAKDDEPEIQSSYSDEDALYWSAPGIN